MHGEAIAGAREDEVSTNPHSFDVRNEQQGDACRAVHYRAAYMCDTPDARQTVAAVNQINPNGSQRFKSSSHAARRVRGLMSDGCRCPT